MAEDSTWHCKFGSASSITLWRRLHKLDTRLAGERLPAAFHALVPLLSVESEGARFAAEQALRRLLTVCFTPELVAAAATQAEAGRPGPPPPAATVVATICGALGASSPQAWPSALSGERPSTTLLHPACILKAWLPRTSHDMLIRMLA